MRSQFDWFAPPTLIQPSPVGNAWYGAVRMCADPVGDDQTQVAVLEGIPRRAGRVLASTVRRHVRGDIRRIERLVQRDGQA